MTSATTNRGAGRRSGRATTLSVIYVSWRDADTVIRSLERLAMSVHRETFPLDVIVVANESDDGTVARIKRAWSEVTVIGNRENRGFGPACNQGAEVASGEILFFVNPDTFAEDEALAEVRDAFAIYPDVVGVAPRLVDEGSVLDERQRTFQLRRFPSVWSDARELLLIDQLFPGNPWQRRAHYLDANRGAPFMVEQAAAAALAVRRDSFEAIGGFDERFRPAYWEDVDLCFRLADRGSILYWPAARFEHIGGASAKELGRSRLLRMYHLNGLRYRTKHYSPPAKLAYRTLLGIGMCMRAMVTLMRSRHSARELRSYLAVAAMSVRRTA